MSDNLPPLTPEQLKQLEQLKDIHLPDAIDWWPLAPGWWILIGMAVTSIIAVILWLIHRHRRVQRSALQALNAIDTNSSAADVAADISALLRRVARLKPANSNLSSDTIATTRGTAWSDFLQQGGMTADIADFIASAPYANPSNSPDKSALIHAAKEWIRRHA